MVHPQQREFSRLWGRLVEQAWSDDAFRDRLVRDPEAVLAEHGYRLPPGSGLRLVITPSKPTHPVLYLPCEGELVDSADAREAGQVAGDCRHNQVVIAALSGLERELASSNDGQ
jgi:hypothetical protein